MPESRKYCAELDLQRNPRGSLAHLMFSFVLFGGGRLLSIMRNQRSLAPPGYPSPKESDAGQTLMLA